jgi:hypothetical protein
MEKFHILSKFQKPLIIKQVQNEGGDARQGLKMHRSRDTFHRTDLTALEYPSFFNEKADSMDVEREQGGAMGCFFA